MTWLLAVVLWCIGNYGVDVNATATPIDNAAIDAGSHRGALPLPPGLGCASVQVTKSGQVECLDRAGRAQPFPSQAAGSSSSSSSTASISNGF